MLNYFVDFVYDFLIIQMIRIHIRFILGRVQNKLRLSSFQRVFSSSAGVPGSKVAEIFLVASSFTSMTCLKFSVGAEIRILETPSSDSTMEMASSSLSFFNLSVISGEFLDDVLSSSSVI